MEERKIIGYRCDNCGAERDKVYAKSCHACGGTQFVTVRAGTTPPPVCSEKRTDLEKFNDAISPEERGLMDALKSGDFITCGAMGQFGEKAAKIVETAISERYFARLHRDQNIAEVKRLSVMIRALRDTLWEEAGNALRPNDTERNCYEADCPNAGTERFSGKYLCPGHAEMYAKIRHDHERERRNDEARADDYDQREKDKADNGGDNEETN